MSPRRPRFASPSIVLLLMAMARAVTGGAALQNAPSQSEVDTLIREVLRDRLTTSGFPDMAAVGGLSAAHYNVRADVLPDVRATSAALPQMPGTVFTLMSQDDAAAMAARTGQRVYFINIGIVTLNATEATVRLGGDFAAPPEPGVIKLCCCSRLAYYTKGTEGWTFRAWGALRCG